MAAPPRPLSVPRLSSSFRRLYCREGLAHPVRGGDTALSSLDYSDRGPLSKLSEGGSTTPLEFRASLPWHGETQPIPERLPCLVSAIIRASAKGLRGTESSGMSGPRSLY